MLTDDELLQVIQRTPLVSIDLIVRDADGRILLGWRNREPAKDNWFVPGGRILRNEDLDVAFRRISSRELGIQYERTQAQLLGVFQHIYDTNFQGLPGIGTHYIVLSYELRPSQLPGRLPTEQHREYRWFTCTDAAHTKEVHPYVLPYFLHPRGPSDSEGTFLEQYAALNDRRDSHNSLLWQTPVLSLTAQAFLFTIALSGQVSSTARSIAASLALLVALGSIQLLIKHRWHERDLAVQLEKIEDERGLIPINKRRKPDVTMNPETWLARLPSYCVWLCLLAVFGIAALLVLLKPSRFVVPDQGAAGYGQNRAAPERPGR